MREYQGVKEFAVCRTCGACNEDHKAEAYQWADKHEGENPGHLVRITLEMRKINPTIQRFRQI